jgi:hypothetical protein
MRKVLSAERAKNRRSTPRRWDYCNMLGVAAIVLGVAVILGIIFTYVDLRQPNSHDAISARINAQASHQLP